MIKNRIDELTKVIIMIVATILGGYLVLMYSSYVVNNVDSISINDPDEYKTLKLGEEWRELSHTPRWYYSGMDYSTTGQGVLTRTGYAGNGGTSIEFRVIDGDSISIFGNEYRVISLTSDSITLKEVTGD